MIIVFMKFVLLLWIVAAAFLLISFIIILIREQFRRAKNRQHLQELAFKASQQSILRRRYHSKIN